MTAAVASMRSPTAAPGWLTATAAVPRGTPASAHDGQVTEPRGRR